MLRIRANRSDRTVKVFFSWSGSRSHDVASVLSARLRKVIQSAEPWLSSDIERGVPWLSEISKGLAEHNIGVICVTPETVGAPWLNYEAGAFSKQLGAEARVIPYLLGFASAGDLDDPLRSLNPSLADEAGTFDLVKMLNAHSKPILSESDLSETFRKWWPDLLSELERIEASDGGEPAKTRSTPEKLHDLLDMTRRITRYVEQNPQYQLTLDRNALRGAADRFGPGIKLSAGGGHSAPAALVPTQRGWGPVGDGMLTATLTEDSPNASYELCQAKCPQRL